MKKYFAVIVFLYFFCQNVFGKDVIVMMTGEKINAVVTEITDNYISYRTDENSDGPRYKISLSRVSHVVFENGTVRNFFLSGEPLPVGGEYYLHGMGYGTDYMDYRLMMMFGGRYIKAKDQRNSGILFALLGAGCLAGSLMGMAAVTDSPKLSMPHYFENGRTGPMVTNNSSVGMVLGAVGICSGIACMGAGITLWVKGNRKINKLYDEMSTRSVSGADSSLSLKSTGAGISLSLSF